MTDLQALDNFFLDKTFIHGERLSVADLAFVSSVKHVYETSLKDQDKKGFKNFNRYYNTVINQPEFKNVSSLQLFKGKPAAAAAAQGPSNADLLDAAEKGDSKKDPFSAVPATTFNFDEFKRCYSNNPANVYLPYFWEKFDAENCSIWLCDYKFNKDLGATFMSANLVRGMLQRLDKARKASFGSMVVFGENNDNIISGLWFWRGQNLMFELTEDWQVDYESFDWKKLDPKDNETKKLVELFFNQDETAVYQGKKLTDGKIFK